jgi:hypothetical protein
MLPRRQGRRAKVFQGYFAWYDFWIGAYYNVEDEILYIQPIPMFGIRIRATKKWRSAFKVARRLQYVGKLPAFETVMLCHLHGHKPVEVKTRHCQYCGRKL